MAERVEKRRLAKGNQVNQNNLKIELARLKSPDRIAKIAKQQLGLIMPTTDKTILMP